MRYEGRAYGDPYKSIGGTPLTRGRRGSILLVLLVSCFLLLLVLALGTMSSINLNLVRSQVEYDQALLTAQGAAAQLIYELDEFELSNDQEVDLSSNTFEIMDLNKRYREKPVFPFGENHVTGEAIITFDDSEDHYSVDNSLVEMPSKGWKDRLKDTKSVPSFAIDLVVKVKEGGSTRYFEAIITRKWSYSAFCARGPVVVTSTGVRKSQKNKGAPAYISGDLLSFYDPIAVQSILVGIPGEGGYPGGGGSQGGGGMGTSPGDVKKFYETVEPASLPLSSIIIGGQGSTDVDNVVTGSICTPAEEPKEGDSSTDNIYIKDPLMIGEKSSLLGKKRYGIKMGSVSWGRNPLSFIKFPDKKDFIEINPADYSSIEVIGSADSSLDMKNGILKWTGSARDYEKFEKLVMDMLADLKEDPNKVWEEYPDLREILEPQLDEILYGKPFMAKGIAMGPREKLMKELIAYFKGDHSFIKEDLVLTGNSKSNKFYLKGNLSNHYIEYEIKGTEMLPGGLRAEAPYPGIDPAPSPSPGNEGEWKIKKEEFSKAGLILKDCTLFVDGDVELSEFGIKQGFINVPMSDPTPDPEKPPKSLIGDNATLVVSGNLRMVGGMLDSKDKGMVVHARNMEFSTKGNFRGLILAQGAITINPYPAEEGKESTETNQLRIIGAVASSGSIVEEEDESEGEGENGEEEDESNPSTTKNLEGLVLRSVNLTFDPKYVKALHRFGTPRIAVWQEIR